MRIFLLSILFAFVAAQSVAAREPLVLRLTQTVIISDATGQDVFCAHPANDEQSRVTGLMFQETLPENAGMVFDFGETVIATMWMRNTILPLDMIFFDENGRVVKIAENTKPFSLDIISSEKPARYVLEVNGGIAKKLDLNIGDQVELGANDCKLS